MARHNVEEHDTVCAWSAGQHHTKGLGNTARWVNTHLKSNRHNMAGHVMSDTPGSS
jgi:hypothetical protein